MTNCAQPGIFVSQARTNSQFRTIMFLKRLIAPFTRATTTVSLHSVVGYAGGTRTQLPASPELFTRDASSPPALAPHLRIPVGETARQKRPGSLSAEIEEKLGRVKMELDDRRPGYRMSDVLGRLETQRLYSGILRPPQDVSKRTKARSQEQPLRDHDDAEARRCVLQRARREIALWIDGIDAVTEHGRPGKRTEDMQLLIKRYFRPAANHLAMTDEVKMSSGGSDIFSGASTLAGLFGASSSAIAVLTGGSLIGSALLLLAGTEGLKQGAEDARRHRRLIKPLKAYREALAELSEELRKASEPSETAELIDKNLKGVQARLRAARQQLHHRLVEAGNSGLDATLGGLGIAGSATALAHAAGAAKALGVAYAAAVAVGGAATALHSGIRLKELTELNSKVKRNLDEDNPLRGALLELLEHEVSTRKNDVAGRSVLAAAGAASLGLQAAGLAGAAPTLGASLGLTAAGVAIGAATGALYRPIKSRRLALKAVGGVERTTNLPTTFLYEPEQLSHLLGKINRESKLIGNLRRRIVSEPAAGTADRSDLFKHVYRFQRVLAKVIPMADRRAVAGRIASRPRALAGPLIEFMQGMTAVERQYLQQHKVPVLQEEVQALLSEFKKADSEPDGAEARKKDLLARQLLVKVHACGSESARLERLQDLESRLKAFADTKSMQREDLMWEDIQVDFIIAHDMVAEALSRNKLKRVQKQLDADLPDTKECESDALRDALRKNVQVRLARVLAHSFPDRIDYERRGAIEVARAMFQKSAPT